MGAFGLLAELADAMDSKSVVRPSKTPENQHISTDSSDALRIPCSDDPQLKAILDAWPKLSAKERRQVAALVSSMGD